MNLCAYCLVVGGQHVEGGAMGNGGESKTSSLSPQCQNKVVRTELLARRSHASGSVKRCAELQSAVAAGDE